MAHKTSKECGNRWNVGCDTQNPVGLKQKKAACPEGQTADLRYSCEGGSERFNRALFGSAWATKCAVDYCESYTTL